MLYELSGISHHYALGRHRVRALDDVSLSVASGDFVAVAGPSGSGKTTLLNLLGLLEAPQHGTIRFEGMDVTRLPERERTRVRRDRLGLVFQGFHLIPVLSARENLEYFLLKGGARNSDVKRRVADALAAVGVSAEAERRPGEMSGGQQQRVALARALVREPSVVLADEPTAALDHATGLAVIDLMRRLNRERGVTFVFSTHDPKILAAASRVLPLEDGKLAA
jgi:putative ABC transport system ATP-binding protein